MITITDDCMGCGMCLEACPVEAIRVKSSKGYAVSYIDKRVCVECKMCLDVDCPADAIVDI